MNSIQELIDQANKFLTFKVNSVSGAIRGLDMEFEDITENPEAFEIYKELCDTMACYAFEDYKQIISRC